MLLFDRFFCWEAVLLATGFLFRVLHWSTLLLATAFFCSLRYGDRASINSQFKIDNGYLLCLSSRIALLLGF